MGGHAAGTNDFTLHGVSMSLTVSQSDRAAIQNPTSSSVAQTPANDDLSQLSSSRENAITGIEKPADVVLRLQDITVRRATELDYATIESLTRDKLVPIEDSRTYRQVGALPGAVSAEELKAFLALGNASALVAERPDAHGKPEIVGFQVSFTGDFLVPTNSQEWGPWIDQTKTDSRFPGYATVTAETLEMEKGSVCHDMVLSKYPRQGIGAALTTAAILEARAAGSDYLYCDIDRRNQPSIRFHKELGFTREEIDPTNSSVFTTSGGKDFRAQWVTYSMDPSALTESQVADLVALTASKIRR